MANDLFRELISIMREYINLFSAETIIMNACEKNGTTPDSVEAMHMPLILLSIATDIDILTNLKSHEFSDMMAKYISLSNRLEEIEHKDMQNIAHKQRSQG